MLKVSINHTTITPIEYETLISRREGLEIQFTFNSEWYNYDKIVTFMGSGVIKEFILTSNSMIVPPECLRVPGGHLFIGVYGTNEDEDVQLTTSFADMGNIYPGAGPNEGITPIPYVADLCFTAEEANSTILLKKVGSGTAWTIQQSFDGITWSSYTLNDTITLQNIGDKVYFHGAASNNITQSASSYHMFQMTGKIGASGNTNSLIGNELLIKNYAFYRLFQNCTALTKMPSLPAPMLSANCYEEMFYGCINLIQVVDLPGTVLANYCYRNMFFGCTSLITAPQMYITSLASACCYSMFEECTSLVNAPELSATPTKNTCYGRMFYNCISLTKAPNLPATVLGDGCYQYMFYNCVNLVIGPEDLPALYAPNGCYQYMFYNCAALTQAPRTIAATSMWAPTSSSEGDSKCYQRMFYKCASLENAPELFFENYPKRGCQYMFSECSKLKYIKIHWTGALSAYSDGCTASWVSGVAPTGDFYYNGSTTTHSNSQIPIGWTIHNF